MPHTAQLLYFLGTAVREGGAMEAKVRLSSPPPVEVTVLGIVQAFHDPARVSCAF